MRIDTSGSGDVYFVAPEKYLGDQRFAYTFTLSFLMQQDNASLPANSSKGDVILEGKWFNQPLVTSLSPPPPDGRTPRRYEVGLRRKLKLFSLWVNKAFILGEFQEFHISLVSQHTNVLQVMINLGY